MEGSINMELLSREIIKPCFPTPPHFKVHPFSFIDNTTPRIYSPIIFFYHPNQVSNPNQTSKNKVWMLKNSLSQILSKYYPFAGRLKDQHSIDCNDEGALVLVTKVKGKLTQILHNPIEALVSPLFPDELHWKEMASDDASLLAIQINCFACGGMAISVCLSHKVGDAATLFTFINDWATISRAETEPPSPVLHTGASMFPIPRDMPSFPEVEVLKDDKKVVCKRFVFEGPKIESLKAKVSSQNVKDPTKAQVVTALIYKCAVSALGLSFKTTSFNFVVNIRRRMVPPLPENSVGNMVYVLFVMNPSETELHDLVRKMKGELSEFCANNFGEGKDVSVFISECIKQASSFAVSGVMENQTMISYSIWSGFKNYQVDFGWGKPIWVTTGSCPFRNTVILIDASDGKGIEAVVNMEENDMAMFERHQELLQYASPKSIPITACKSNI